MFWSKHKKEIESLNKQIKDLDSKLSEMSSDLYMYKSFFNSIEEIKKNGGKILRPNDLITISSFIDDQLFKKCFSGSINYLKSNKIVNDNVEINETTLEAYKIATHKFVKEYFNFSLWCAFDNLDCIGSYKQIIEKKKQEEKDKKEKKCKSNGKN